MQPPEPQSGLGSTAIIAVMVSLTLLTLGAVAFVVLSGEDDDPEKPRVVVLPMREPEVPFITELEREEPTTDQGLADAGPTENGCGKEPPHRKRDTMKMPGREISVFIPTNYDSAKPAPLVLLFHDDHQTANGFYWDTGFEEVAEEHNVLLAFPRDQDLLHWRDHDDIHVGEDALAFMNELLCVDNERVFAIGNGSGGDLVERLACKIPIRAMATTAHRSGRAIGCPKTKMPYLHIANLRDGHLPPDGGKTCYDEIVPSIDHHEKAWRDRNGCEGGPRNYLRKNDHQCWSYSCDTTFVSCHLDSGRGWPLQDKPRALDFLSCDGDPPVDFPLAAVIWGFFAAHMP